MTSHGTVCLRTDMWRITLRVGAREPIVFDKLDVINNDVTIWRLHTSDDNSMLQQLLVLARHRLGLITAQPLDATGEAVGDPLLFEGEMQVRLVVDSNDSSPQLMSVRIKKSKRTP